MKILLDTHILLWALGDSPLLTEQARSFIADEANDCFFSPVSLAEIAIKHQKHPAQIALSAGEIRAALITSGYRELPYSARHAAAMDNLPPHHADSFDRMLVAQALSEGVKFMSHDDKVAKYGEVVISV